MEQQPNLDYIKELSGDDKSFENKFILVLKEEIPIEKQEYLDGILSGNFKETADIVHKLKHKLNILGLSDAYTLAVQFEEELKEEDNSLKDEFLVILNTIEDYIKKL